MRIAIYGLGYVGLTAAGCLTREGHEVIGIDVSETKVAEVAAGKSPIKEPGLDELLQEALRKGLLSATTSGAERINSCDIAMVCVGTPSGPDGAHNMSFIAEVSRQIAASVDRRREVPLTVIYRSTIRPGTIEGLIRPIFDATLGPDVGAVEIVYLPEFLREAVAIKDYFAPPKIVVGTHDGRPNPRVDALNRNIDAPVFHTRYREAEFTKFVDNTFHALKVTFANEIGRICLRLGISARTVHEIFVSDTKLNISSYYLRPGGAFGGSCLPKDVRALQYIAADIGAHTQVIDQLIRSNETHKHFLFEHVVADLPPGARVLQLGLAFKADSDDLRESPKVDMARKLLQAGYRLSIYDPEIVPSQLVGQNLGYIFAHLPALPNLLVSREAAEGGEYDLVVDASGMAKTLALKARRIVDINMLD